jgi:hypothetical protein
MINTTDITIKLTDRQFSQLIDLFIDSAFVSTANYTSVPTGADGKRSLLLIPSYARIWALYDSAFKGSLRQNLTVKNLLAWELEIQELLSATVADLAKRITDQNENSFEGRYSTQEIIKIIGQRNRNVALVIDILQSHNIAIPDVR